MQIYLSAIADKDFDSMSNLWNRAIYSNRKPLPEDNKLYINATLKQRNLVDVYWALALFNMSNEYNGYSAGDNRINEIEAPVLSFWGEKDIIIPEAAARETVEALGDKAQLIILEDSGHSPLIDCPVCFRLPIVPKSRGYVSWNRQIQIASMSSTGARLDAGKFESMLLY